MFLIFAALFEDSPARPRTIVIAEAGVNHNGDPDLAAALIEAAAQAGAGAIKFQAFLPEAMILPGTGKAGYQRQSGLMNEDQFQMLKRLQLGPAELKRLQAKAEAEGIFFLASVFDEISAGQLREIGARAYKIPSGEITNLPLIALVASFGMPVIISTGMATLGEIEEAVQTALNAGNRRLILLHCVSSYPAPYSSLNLTAIATLRAAFGLPVGYSDHAEGAEAAIAAVALGAMVLEKHFTLDRNLPGPDHKASLGPGEFRQLVESIRKVESAFGDGRKVLAEAERETRALTRKSLVANQPIAAQALITREMIGCKRPGNGLPPKYLGYFIGARATRFIAQDTLLGWSDAVKGEED